VRQLFNYFLDILITVTVTKNIKFISRVLELVGYVDGKDNSDEVTLICNREPLDLFREASEDLTRLNSFILIKP
jgi:hypothetical protein